MKHFANLIFRFIWFLIVSLIVSVIVATLGYFFFDVIFKSHYVFQDVLRNCFIGIFLVLWVIYITIILNFFIPNWVKYLLYRMTIELSRNGDKFINPADPFIKSIAEALYLEGATSLYINRTVIKLWWEKVKDQTRPRIISKHEPLVKMIITKA
jgi:hypothetical protein